MDFRQKEKTRKNKYARDYRKHIKTQIERTICPCGGFYREYNTQSTPKHINTKMHKNYLKDKEKQLGDIETMREMKINSIILNKNENLEEKNKNIFKRMGGTDEEYSVFRDWQKSYSTKRII